MEKNELNKLYVALLGQDEVWRNGHGTYLKIESITNLEYLTNIRHYLLEFSKEYQMLSRGMGSNYTPRLTHAPGVGATDASMAWMRRQPIFKAVDRQILAKSPQTSKWLQITYGRSRTGENRPKVKVEMHERNAELIGRFVLQNAYAEHPMRIKVVQQPASGPTEGDILMNVEDARWSTAKFYGMNLNNIPEGRIVEHAEEYDDE